MWELNLAGDIEERILAVVRRRLRENGGELGRGFGFRHDIFGAINDYMSNYIVVMWSREEIRNVVENHLGKKVSDDSWHGFANNYINKPSSWFIKGTGLSTRYIIDKVNEYNSIVGFVFEEENKAYIRKGVLSAKIKIHMQRNSVDFQTMIYDYCEEYGYTLELSKELNVPYVYFSIKVKIESDNPSSKDILALKSLRDEIKRYED